MDITVTFPNVLLVATKENPEEFQRNVMVYTLSHLYQQGKISSGLAAQILGCSRWEFYRLLAEYGFAVIDYAEDELMQEAQIGPEWYPAKVTA